MSDENFPILINVGLPRTGTQSLDELMTQLGYKCGHIGYGEHDLEALNEFARTGKGKIFEFMKGFDFLGDSPYYGLIEAFLAFYPKTNLIATARDKKSWIQSLNNKHQAQSTYLMHTYGKGQDLSGIYDMHIKKIERNGITTIFLDDPDQTKLDKVFETLRINSTTVTKYPKVDLFGKRGFKNSEAQKRVESQ